MPGPGQLWYIQWKETQSCSVCGIRDPMVLENHHIHPEQKSYSVGSMVSKQMPIKAIQEEIRKTVPLCSNCHIRTHNLFFRGITKTIIPAEMSKREKLMVSGKIRP